METLRKSQEFFSDEIKDPYTENEKNIRGGKGGAKRKRNVENNANSSGLFSCELCAFKTKYKTTEINLK